MSKFCETCSFWRYLRETEPHVGIGECRRHAPVPIAEMVSTDFANGNIDATSWLARWRQTMFDDWCGEHQPTNFKPAGGEWCRP